VGVDAGVEHAVLDLEAKRIAAMVSRDLTTLASMLADDLSYSHSSGRTDNKASFLELVRSGHYLAVDFPEREVVPCGDAVVVRGRAQMQVHQGGADLSYPIRFLDVWARRGSDWQLLAWQATRIPA
jgi:ketosteroid isomerase-like protein